MAQRPAKPAPEDDLDNESGGPAPRPAAPRRKPWKMILGVMGLALVIAAVREATRPPEVPQDVRLKQSLRYLDDHKNHAARLIADALREAGYQDPDFAGGVPYVIGMVEFRDADDLDAATREQRYIVAAGNLREAGQLGLIAERRPEWAYTLGLCLHRIGFADEAMPLLEEAIDSFPAGKVAASLLLAESYLDTRQRDQSEKALAINSKLLEDAAIPETQRDHVYLQRAQILMSLDRRADAEEAMTKVSKLPFVNQGAVVLRAQTYIAEKKFREALEILAPVANDEGLERTFPAQASYLQGVCAEKLDELENAVAYFERALERFEGSHEALAARMGAADAFRKLGRNEEALDAYSYVLRSVRRPKQFRNRWLTLRRLREQVQDAWNGWTESHFYAEAIALADLMSPAIPLDKALELAARANQLWAQHREAEIAALPYDKQQEHQAELHLRWQQCGLAYGRLAETRKTSTAYADALWSSAEDFMKGHDFVNALAQYSQFINTRASNLLPTALLRRGQTLMNLDRQDEALRDFREIIKSYPTDPASFQARYLVGQCHFERNEPDLAEKSWRTIIESNDLTPAAQEWQHALFSLGRLQYFLADLAQNAAKLSKAAPAPRAADGRETSPAAYTRFDDAVLRLEEFLERYPSSADALEARYLLAKSLQQRSELPEEKLQTAETDNARNEFRRQVVEALERAIREFQQAQNELHVRQTEGRLDRVGQVMLRNCLLNAAHCYFRLGRYDDAIAAYSSSAGHYQQEPDSLTAFVQIANCYDRLRKPAEALSTLAQARLMLKQLPEEAFAAGNGTMSRNEWDTWLDWAMRLHQ